MEERLASPDRSRLLFESAPIAIFVVDLTRYPAVVLEANRRGESLYGWPSASLAGSPITRLVLEESWAKIQSLLHRLGPQETLCVQSTQRHRDGTAFPGRLHIGLHPANPLHVIVAVDDLRVGALGPQLLRTVPREVHPGIAAEALTGGEMEVLRLVAQGVDNKDIAAALNASVYTVANRLRTIYEKLAVTNRTQAALYALRQGWAPLGEID